MEVAKLLELKVGPVRGNVWLPKGDPTFPLGQTKLGLPKVGLLVTTKFGLKLVNIGWDKFWLITSSCLGVMSLPGVS